MGGVMRDEFVRCARRLESLDKASPPKTRLDEAAGAKPNGCFAGKMPAGCQRSQYGAFPVATSCFGGHRR